MKKPAGIHSIPINIIHFNPPRHLITLQSLWVLICLTIYNKIKLLIEADKKVHYKPLSQA